MRWLASRFESQMVCEVKRNVKVKLLFPVALAWTLVEQRSGTQLEAVLLYLHMEVSCFRVGVRQMSRCRSLPLCS